MHSWELCDTLTIIVENCRIFDSSDPGVGQFREAARRHARLRSGISTSKTALLHHGYGDAMSFETLQVIARL